MSHEPNLALATATTLTDRKAYDIASWLYDIARWLHEQGEQAMPPTVEPVKYDFLREEAEKKAQKQYKIWSKTPPGIMYKLKEWVENCIDTHSSPHSSPIDWPRTTFEGDMRQLLQQAIDSLKNCQDGGGAECQKLIERGKFFFSFWMPEPVAAAIVNIRGGAVEEDSGAAGYTLTPTASTSPRLKM